MAELYSGDITFVNGGFMKKEVQIACKGHETIDYEWLEEFQGDLVDLSEDNYKKLKNEIAVEGYSFAIHIWKLKNQNFILDGHQRLRTIKRMVEKEGWACPQLPVVVVEAKSIAQAKRKLLAARSNYGDNNKQGLYKYMSDNKIKFNEVEKRYRFAGVNFKQFNEEFYVEPPEKSVPKLVKETKEVTFNKYECPSCGHQFYEGDKKPTAKGPILRKGPKNKRG